MARLVKFERPGERYPIYVNPDHVVAIGRQGTHDETAIVVAGLPIAEVVKGTPEDVRYALESAG